MTEEKYRTHELCQYDYSDIWEKSFDENYTDKPLRNDELVEILNSQDKRIKELEKKIKVIINEQNKYIINNINRSSYLRRHSRMYEHEQRKNSSGK